MTAIYYDPDDDRVFIEGALQTYAPRTLTADCSADMVWIRLKVRTSNEFGPVSYAAITDRNGAGFGDAASAVAYLLGEFAKTRPVGEAFGTATVAGSDLIQGQPVAVSRLTGQLMPARADAYPLAFVAGLASVDTASGFTVQPAHGAVRLPDWSAFTGSPELRPGLPYFLAPTGGLTTTPDRTSVCLTLVGYAASPVTLVADPQAPILL